MSPKTKSGSKKEQTASKSKTPIAEEARKYRNFPFHSLQAALVLPQKIQDEMGGKPMNRLLLADALGLSPSSSNYRNLLSSAYKYGLTDGTEKATEIGLTDTGQEATSADQTRRLAGIRKAALTPSVFGQLFRDYANKRLPSAEMLPKILAQQYGVPSALTAECANFLAENGRYAEIVRDIGGSPHVLLDAEQMKAPPVPPPESAGEEAESTREDEEAEQTIRGMPEAAPPPPAAPVKSGAAAAPKPIFVGHGKNKAPLLQLQKLLTTFQIPHKVAIDEPHLGRPIPQKVKDIILECGSAILIFTRDEKFFDDKGNELWRPSENVVYELGAASFLYDDRIVIFKEKGLHFPTNFQSIGYIEFDHDDLEARTADLLKELIGFGLVKVTPT